jgi:predicted nucleic acid-binding protein
VVGEAGGVYLDASALVKLVVSEAETEALRTFLTDKPRRMSSRIAEVEVTRAVGRIATPGDEAQVRIVLSGLQFIELDAGTAEVAGSLAPATLRSLDAVHLASALAVAPELDAFVTYDARLAAAARAAGLEVAAPA